MSTVAGMDKLPRQPHEAKNISQTEHAQAFKDEISEYADAAKADSPHAATAIERVVASTHGAIDDTNRKTRNDETLAVNRFLTQSDTGKQNIELAKEGGDHHSINERMIEKIRNSSQTTTETTGSAMNDTHSAAEVSNIADEQHQMVDGAKQKAGELSQQASDKVTDLKNQAKDTANDVSNKAQHAYNDASVRAQQTKEQVSDSLQSAKETTLDKLHQARDSVDRYAEAAKENTSSALAHAQQTASSTAEALKKRSSETAAEISQSASELSAAAKVRFEQTKHQLAEGAQQLSDGLRQKYDAAKAYVSDTAATAEQRVQQAAHSNTKFEPSAHTSEKSEDGSFKDVSYETTPSSAPLPMSDETQTTHTQYVSNNFGPQGGAMAASFVEHAMGAAETAHAEPVGLGSGAGVNTGSIPPVDPMFDAGAKLGYATEQMNEM